MSRITKWKLEKTKVKVVFRLQFHATHIPSSGWEKLFISFIPTELGKTTAKTTKANVRNGTCKWADPIYETTRLLQDTKTKPYDEKLYKLVVSMGSSRTSTLGDATINLADYADALKPSAVAIPLHGCNYGTILHVTVQLLTSKTGFREFEQQRELRENGLQIGTESNRRDESPNNKLSTLEASAIDQMDKILESKGVHGIRESALLNQANMALSNSKNIAVDSFQVQSLKSSIEHLHEELERMKNENSPFPQAKYDPYVQDLRRELVHLHVANQELGSIFPLFNDFTGSGNALERVLALEIELAEALRAKKKSSFHIQSSFLKQHSDEESIFRSFRDINELIKDMLELKGKYAGVETELREMHDRYSDLSLQFAEVEGERQKLMMTFKNIRTSKKLVHLSRSSSDTLCDHPL